MPEIQRQYLRDRAQRLGLTPVKLAVACECSTDHIRSILLGRRDPSISLTHQLAKALRCKPDDLLAQPVQLAGKTRLHSLRVAAGLAPRELARRARISPTHLNNLEAGRRTASKRVLEDLANALPGDCDPGELLDVEAA